MARTKPDPKPVESVPADDAVGGPAAMTEAPPEPEETVVSEYPALKALPDGSPCAICSAYRRIISMEHGCHRCTQYRRIPEYFRLPSGVKGAQPCPVGPIMSKQQLVREQAKAK